MIRHALRMIAAQFRRQTTQSILTVAGLALGLASAMLIGLYVLQETSYDKQFDRSEDIYRMVFDWRSSDGSYTEDCTTPAAFAWRMKEELPAVEEVTTFIPPWGYAYLVQNGDKVFYEDRGFLAKSNFFKVFSYTFLEGKPETALANLNSVVLTASTREKYFGDALALGKTLMIEGYPFTVSGVIEDPPVASHLHFDLMGNIEQRFQVWGLEHPEDAWNQWILYTYVLMAPGTDMEKFWQDMIPFLDKHNEEEPIDWANPEMRHVFQPLTSIHLNSHRRWELETNGDGQRVLMFSGVAALVLLLASFNFLNLSTARAVARAREVGVRKVVGAGRLQLVALFLFETMVVVVISLMIAMLLLELGLPLFNHQLGVELTMSPLRTPRAFLALFGLVAAITLLSGGYPAWVMAGFQPVRVLKGLLDGGRQGFTLRKILVTAQFAVTIGLMTATGLMALQLNYMAHRSKGMDTGDVVYVPLRNGSRNQYNAIKEELLADPSITQVSSSGGVPGKLNWTTNITSDETDEEVLVNFMNVGRSFCELLDMQLAMGRWFGDTETPDGIIPLVLNETAVKRFHIEEAPIGARLSAGEGREYEVVGVLKDFHFRSMHYRIDPFGFFLGLEPGYLFVRIADGQDARGLDHLKSVWSDLLPGLPLEYHYLDDVYDQLHQSDMKTRFLVSLFSGFALLIALLGLFGLVAYSAQRRKHEVAVRKVLGASMPNLLTLLSREFLLLVLLSSVVALPLSYLAMKSWLENFAYRAQMSAWPFVAGVLLVIFAASLTSLLQTMSVARRSPVQSLRSE